MAKTLQHRRGTTTELASVTGAIGEIFMDTTKKTLVVMDGTTVGGVPLAKESDVGSGGSVGGDAVFNSALIGDVAIIANTLSGTDAYGNDTSLVLNSPVDFKTIITTTSGSQVSTLIGPAAININQMDGIRFYSFNSPSPSEVQEISVLPAGTVITTSDIFSYTTYSNIRFRFTISSSNVITDPYDPSSITNIYFTPQGGAFEYSQDSGSSWISTNINSYSTNGQTSGLTVSYDNTVITNTETTLATVDATGLTVNSELTLGGDVTFNQPSLDFITTVTENNQASLALDSNNLVTTNNALYFGNLSNYQAQALALAAIPNGTLVTTNTLFNSGTYQNQVIKFVLGNNYVSYDPYNPSIIQTITIYPTGSIQVSNDGGNTWSNLDPNQYFNYYSQSSTLTLNYGGITQVTKAVASLTATGLLTDSALIGDVSIIGNTIAGVDSYGNADTLIVDGDLQVTGVVSGLKLPSIPGIVAYDAKNNVDYTFSSYGPPNGTGQTTDMNFSPSSPGAFESFLGGMIAGLTVDIYDTNNVLYATSIVTNVVNNSGAVTLTVSPFTATTDASRLVFKAIAAPINPATVAKWINIVVDGQTYFTPLYQ